MTDEVTLQWSTPQSGIAALYGGGAVLAIAGVLIPTELSGQVLVLLGAAGLVFIATFALRQRPRLAVLPGDSGIECVRISGRRVFTKEQIERIRVVKYPRLGRRVPMLEIDVLDGDYERLLIFGRWDLGERPQTVFDALAVHGLVPPDGAVSAD
ncbi:MAG: PH domain-containing protein [Rhodococcus sp.]|nr:PH domain-containing protein [Rhodococcus sp. (in: high G+C Gram-positive bacteria)]